MLKFNSTRKRSSVIMRQSNTLIMFTKGVDNVFAARRIRDFEVMRATRAHFQF